METPVDVPGRLLRLGAGRAITLWILFFLISFGLGYATLNRYDARKLGPDWQGYYRMVLHQEPPEDFPFSSRVLVPAVARPFYALANGRLHTWDPVFFGLLVANCLFCASATFLLLLIGLRAVGDLPIALLGCTLYLLNFVISQLWLTGMVDSSEGFLLLAVAWSLFSGRWWLLPLIAIPGGMAKQSFVPFATLFAATWGLMAERRTGKYWKLAWVAALGCVSAISLVLVHRAVAGETTTPWAMAAWWNSSNNYLLTALHGLRDQQFWYAFIWLLPLGVWRLNRLPRPWVAASAVTGFFAILLGGYADLGGTVNRPLFNVVGPMLSLSVAILIAGDQSRRAAD